MSKLWAHYHYNVHNSYNKTKKKVMLPIGKFVMYVKPAPFTRGVCRFTYSKQSRKPFVTTTLYSKMGRGVRYNLFK